MDSIELLEKLLDELSEEEWNAYFDDADGVQWEGPSIEEFLLHISNNHPNKH